MRCCIASSTMSRLKDQGNSARLHLPPPTGQPSAPSRKARMRPRPPRASAHKPLDFRVPTLSIECEPLRAALAILRMSSPPKARNPPRLVSLMFPYGVRNAHTLSGEPDLPCRAREISTCIVLEKFEMNAKELADKFNAKTDAAVVERARQSGLAAEHIQKRSEDIEHCKRAMESNVLPFLAELKHHLGEGQFTFAPQIDIQDHKPVGVSFKIGDGGTTSISTALGNIIVTRAGDGGTKRGLAYVYPPDAEPYISNSGDLTRDKIAKLVEMVIDNT